MVQDKGENHLKPTVNTKNDNGRAGQRDRIAQHVIYSNRAKGG